MTTQSPEATWINTTSPTIDLAVNQAISQARDTVTWILDREPGLSDEIAEMTEILERLDVSMETAQKLYSERYSQDFWRVKASMMEIEFSNDEGKITPDNVAIKCIFSGPLGTQPSPESRAGFQDLLFTFSAQTPEVQSYMLWFFDRIENYSAYPKNRSPQFQNNQLVRLLFCDDETPTYLAWIRAVFAAFAMSTSDMIELSEAIHRIERSGGEALPREIVLARWFKHMMLAQETTLVPPTFPKPAND